MKLLIATTFALGATFSTLSADSCGGCKKKGDGCKKKDETTMSVSYENEGCKKGGGCKKKGDGCKKEEA